jgi:hypothetical protein
MYHLDQIFIKELHDALGNIEGKKPTQRPLAENDCKIGATQINFA